MKESEVVGKKINKNSYRQGIQYSSSSVSLLESNNSMLLKIFLQWKSCQTQNAKIWYGR